MKNCFDNWSDVRVFLAVCRHGSTLAASRVLGLAQPTVARRIEALEQALELTLFERDTRGFRPTAVATALLPKAETIETAVEALHAVALDHAKPKPIRIAAFAENLSAPTIALLSAFNEDHPGVNFEFLPGVGLADLMGGEADIAIRIAFSEPDPNLIQRRISTAQFTLFGSKSYAEAHGLPSSPDDLDGHTLVSFRRDDASPFTHDWITRHARPEQILRICTEVDLALADIRSGRALGLVNLRMAADYPELVPCFDPPPELDSPNLLLVSPEAWRRHEVKAFVRFFAPRYAARFR